MASRNALISLQRNLVLQEALDQEGKTAPASGTEEGSWARGAPSVQTVDGLPPHYHLKGGRKGLCELPSSL